MMAAQARGQIRVHISSLRRDDAAHGQIFDFDVGGERNNTRNLAPRTRRVDQRNRGSITVAEQHRPPDS